MRDRRKCRSPLRAINVIALSDVGRTQLFQGLPASACGALRGFWEARSGRVVPAEGTIALGGFDDATGGRHGGEAVVEGGDANADYGDGVVE